MKPKPNLSQSLLKAYVDYYDLNVKGCGKELHYRFFEKIPTESSDVMRLGIYFEWLATGYLRDGDAAPQPDMVYKGTAKEKLSAPYERAQQAVELYRQMIEKHEVEILTTGEYMYWQETSGITDLRVKWKGEEAIIDLKYTALIDDKWSEYGWNTEQLIYKPKLLLQPVHYKWMARYLYGIEDIPFYYWIFSSQDPTKAKIIKVNVQEEHLVLHEENYINKMKKYIEYHYNNPDKLEARPNYSRCSGCAFKGICPSKAEIPLIEEIYY
jgi:hypothetical protein